MFVSITAPWLPPEMRQQRLTSALARIPAAPHDFLKAPQLEALAPRLTKELVPEALQIANRLDQSHQFEVYCALAEAPATQRDRAQIVAFLRDNAPALAGPKTFGRLAAAGLADLVFEIALASNSPGGRFGALTLGAAYLDEELLGSAHELALKESREGRREGLRAVLARIAEIGSWDGPRRALEATYVVALHEDSRSAAAIALSSEPPISWERELAGISSGALRYTVLAARAARLPMPAHTVGPVVDTLDFSYRGVGLRAVLGAVESRQIPDAGLGGLVLDHGFATADFPLLEAYFTLLADEAGPDYAIGRAQQSGYLAAAIAVDACRPHLPQTATDALAAYAMERSRLAATLRNRRSKMRDVAEEMRDRWSLTALLAALLPRDGYDPAHPLWESVTQLLEGETTLPDFLDFSPVATISSNKTAAALLFKVLPRSYLPAANMLILEGGLLAGPWRPTRNNSHSWAADAAALIDSVDLNELPVFCRSITRQVESAGGKDVLFAAIAGRYARLGRSAEALDTASGSTFSQTQALQKMAFDMPAASLPAWVATVCRQLRRPAMEQQRAAVLASASARWKASSANIRHDAIRSWLNLSPPPSREDIIMEITGLSTLLIEAGANPALLLGAMTSDLSLQSLSSIGLLWPR